MTVKEVFELRKQGKIEEAYEAIRPMYAVHQCKYTSLSRMFNSYELVGNYNTLLGRAKRL